MEGSGDYHYISLFRAEMLEEDFTLVLFDHHPDDQPPSLCPGMLSCGSWVAHVRKLPHCVGDVWIDSAQCRAALPESGNVFLSIDLDVLSEEYARTDWDQGDMTLDELCGMVGRLQKTCRILAVDICGGLDESKGGRDKDAETNDAAVRKIISLLRNRETDSSR